MSLFATSGSSERLLPTAPSPAAWIGACIVMALAVSVFGPTPLTTFLCTFACLGIGGQDWGRSAPILDAVSWGHGGGWLDTASGGRPGFIDPARLAADPAVELTLSGFRIRLRDRTSVRRSAVRVASGTIACVLGYALGLFAWGVSGAYLLAAVMTYAMYWALPAAALLLVALGFWQRKRRLEWGGEVVLDGAVLRTRKGVFVFSDPAFEVFVDVDIWGARFVVRDATQELVLRGALADLMWLADQVRDVRVVEGSGDDVPEAIRQLAKRPVGEPDR